MHSLGKLNQLFIRHLRTVYNGEMILADALHHMLSATSDENLRRFYQAKMTEKQRIVRVLEHTLQGMNHAANGEQDRIIASFTEQVNDPRLTETKALYSAIMIFGRALSVYMANSWETAISCANDLGMEEVAQELSGCARFDKYNKSEFEFLRQCAAERMAQPVAA